MVCLVWSLSGLFLAMSGEPLKNFLVLHMCGAFLIPPVLLVFGRSDEVLQSFKKTVQTTVGLFGMLLDEQLQHCHSC